MANDLVSYQRFTTLPPNNARFGATVEELQLQRGRPDPDPSLSPLPDRRISAARLALAPAGSDRLRLAVTSAPEPDPREGPRSTLALTRRALDKLSGDVAGDLQRAIPAAAVTPESRAVMNDAIRRALEGLCEHLRTSVRLAEGVHARCLAAAKG